MLRPFNHHTEALRSTHPAVTTVGLRELPQMNRRAREHEATALIRRLEDGNVRSIRGRDVADNFRNLSTAPWTNMFRLLDSLGFEIHQVSNSTVPSIRVDSDTSGCAANSFDTVPLWDTLYKSA